MNHRKFECKQIMSVNGVGFDVGDVYRCTDPQENMWFECERSMEQVHNLSRARQMRDELLSKMANVMYPEQCIERKEPLHRKTTRNCDEFQCPWCGLLFKGEPISSSRLGIITKCASCSGLSQFEKHEYSGLKEHTSTWCALTSEELNYISNVRPTL